MWYLHCFDSPKKEFMLKTLMFKSLSDLARYFKSLSDLARCVMIPRRIITQFYYARQTYNPVKASNIEWARHVLKFPSAINRSRLQLAQKCSERGEMNPSRRPVSSTR